MFIGAIDNRMKYTVEFISAINGRGTCASLSTTVSQKRTITHVRISTPNTYSIRDKLKQIDYGPERLFPYSPSCCLPSVRIDPATSPFSIEFLSGAILSYRTYNIIVVFYVYGCQSLDK